MLAYTREKLLNHLQETSRLIDLYQQHDASYVAEVVAWMARVEETLAQLRLPLTSLVAAERARLLAVADGYRDPTLIGERLTARMVARAVASLGLARVQDEMRRKVAAIDGQFDGWREKMAQLIAIASSKTPIPLPPSEPRDAWLATVWKGLDVGGEVQGMYRYLGAAMAPSDRLALLDEVLEQLLSGL